MTKRPINDSYSLETTMHSLSPSYVLGLTFIVLVAILWSASSILTQYLYSDRYSFDSPFLLTYIGVSLFSLWLPTHKVMAWMKQNATIRSHDERHVTFEIPSSSSYQDAPVQLLNGDDDNDPERTQQAVSGDKAEEAAVIGSEIYQTQQDRLQPSPLHGSENVPHTTSTHIDGNRPQAQPTIPASPEDSVIHGLSHGSSSQQQQQQQPWTRQDHFIAAAKIAPVWFLANWTYNSSLAYTTITSSTVLASTGSLFTFGFAVMTRDESFGWIKFGGVLLGVAGSVLTALGDSSSGSGEDPVDDPDSGPMRHVMEGHWEHRLLAESSSTASHHSSLWGDALGLISAVGYGAYAVQTRILCPHDESLYSMQVLLGYIGLICMIGLSPIALYQAISSAQLSLVVLGFLFIKGLFDNVISDYLWLRSVILTNATVATVGLGLTIPLAFLSDIFVTDHASSVVTFHAVLGAVCVLAGFVLVNVGNNDEETPLPVSYEALDCVESNDSADGAMIVHVGEQELSNRHEASP